MKIKIFLVVLVVVVAIQPVTPCTTFILKDSKGEVAFGRNFDFPVGMGHVTINQRNQLKTAFIRQPEKPMEWISKYGSITFNQIGREFPYGGMNEAGLVIEQMWLQEAVYPEPDHRYGLSELQWIQYQLDNSATVQEVIDSDTLVRISFTSVATLHFLVADKSGDVATIEFIDGKRIVHRGDNLPYPVLANCPYDRSLDYKNQKDSGSEKTFSGWTENSSGRFLKAASMIEAYKGETPKVDYAFKILDEVSQENATQWSIVYDPAESAIYYKTNQNKTIRTINLQTKYFECEGDKLYADIQTNVDGIQDFKPYSCEANLELIRQVVSGVDFLRNSVSDEANIAMAKYPQSVTCVDVSQQKSSIR